MLYADFLNSSGHAYSQVTVSYSVEKYRNGTNADGFSIRLFYSTNGTTWTAAGSDFITSFAADADNNGFTGAPGSTTRIDTKTVSVAVANGAHLYLCWHYAKTKDSTGVWSSAQALGVDDVIVVAGSEAKLRFNEVHYYSTDTQWVEFQAVSGGALYDSLAFYRVNSIDTYSFGQGQEVAAGDYIVLWVGGASGGTGDAAKADGPTATAWDIYMTNGLTTTDAGYAVYMSGATTMQDFVAWSDAGAAMSASLQRGMTLAMQQGQWECLGDTHGSFDCVMSYGDGGKHWGIQRNANGDDTNSKYGWEYYNGVGTRGAVNTAFRNYQGTGRWEVTPAVNVAANASGTWKFSYLSDKYEYGDNTASGYLTLTIPPGWTKPQDTDAAAPGYVTVEGNWTDAIDALGQTNAIIRDSTIIVCLNGSDSTSRPDSVTIVYGTGGGAAAAVAPATLGTHTFVMRSDPWGTNVSALDSSPTLTVVAANKPAVYLRDTPSVTLYANATNATLLAGRIVGDSTGDTLLGMTIRNLGTANDNDTRYESGHGGLNLWQDVNGDSAWDSGDSWVSTLNWRATGYWGFSASTVLMPAGVFNFVVTTNISATPTNGHTFQLRVGTDSVATDRYGWGPLADTTNSGIQTISYTAATAPFIWSAKMDSTSTAKLLAEQTYSCTITFTDSNGFAEIDSCVVLINSSTEFAAGDSCAYFKFDENSRHFALWNDTTQSWIDCGDTSAFSGGQNNYVTLVGGTATRSGNTLTVGWVFRPKFGWNDEACNVYANVTDSVPSSPGWQNVLAATTENDLTFIGTPAVTSGYHGPLTNYGAQWVHTGETLAWSGLTVVYQGTTLACGDTFFDIRIRDTDATTDTIDVTGVLDTITVAGEDAGVDTYAFKITGCPGGSDVSDTWFTLRIDPVVPATLTLTAASAGSDTVRLTWTALTHDNLSPFVRYEIYWDTVAGIGTNDSLWTSSEHSLLAAIGADSTIVTGLWSQATYYFAIRGVDTAGNAGILSNEVNRTTGEELWAFTVAAPATGYRNDSFSITITALNRLGGTYTGFADTAYLTVDTGAIYPIATSGFVNEVKTLDVQIDTLGANVIHASAGSADAIFFSEYYKGDVQNKYLEIFNGTGQTLNLAGYSL
ncbi:MAG TPA: fibronectin type III domain-containing protein, partial [bacterium]|nr:fibronectin type III domain-containing protein [bacterium]